jgi:hypothetical protein
MRSLFSFLLLSSASLFAQTEPLADTDEPVETHLPAQMHDASNLPLACYFIPAHDDQLCIATTASEFAPVDDLIFYKRYKDQQLSLLRVDKGDIAVTWLHGFSNGGKYLILGKAEEGHPSFVIFATTEFLSDKEIVEPVALISNYFIDALMKLSDDGIAEVSYSSSTGCDHTSYDDCVFKLDIFKQESIVK